MELLFLASTALILYTYFGYPLLLLLAGSVTQLRRDIAFGLGRRDRRAAAWLAAPKVSLVFAAHNEEAVIGQKMINCRDLDYPTDQLEILIGCDACTDRTAATARAAGLPNATVFEFGERGGKPSVLNRLVPKARGDLIVFCDANTLFEPHTVTSLVRHFADPRVGCVCGQLRLRRPDGKPSAEGLYWKYETLLKFLESRHNMLVGANGGVFAVRKSLYVPIPDDGIIDDFLVAMNVRADGHRVVYDPEAVAWEEVAPTLEQEFRRRVRIGTGNFQALRHTWRLLNPAAGLIALSYWSHKVLRWLVPVAFIVGEAAALALARDVRYAVCAALGAVLLAAAWMGYRLERRGRHWSPVSIPYYFVLMNLALLLGLVRFLFGGSPSTVWNPTARESTGATTLVAPEPPVDSEPSSDKDGVAAKVRLV